jgi:CTP synthase (UTP-ammonia lyase)
MSESLKIGIFGDLDNSRYSQIKTNEALDHASKELSVSIDTVWLTTQSLGNQKHTDLVNFHGFWAGPGDYLNPDGALQAIKFCREQQWPFIGT